MKNSYAISIDNVLKDLNTNLDGLNKTESHKRQMKFGQNKLPESKKQGKLKKFFMQFKDIMIIILLIAATISITLAIIEKNYSDLLEGGVILFIVLLNAIIGVIQESKAEDALESLKKSTEPYAKVLRGGVVTKIKTSHLTQGDIVILEAGDIVPADLRLIETHNLKCDESALTGESNSISKDASIILKETTPLAERKNMAFSSTIVTFGRAKGVVTEIGIDTEIGKIAKILNSTKKELTPLEKSIKKIGKIISISVILIAIVIFLVEVFFADTFDILNAFLTSVTLAVAAIPESLPAVITIIMAIGVQNLAKKGAIIKQLKAVETLGSCEVICSDKTGTLTQNKMQVEKLSINFNTYSKLNKTIEADLLIKSMTLCNDSYLGENNKIIGDPTETALLDFCLKNNLNKEYKKYERVYEIPFDSNRKLMTTVNIVNDKLIAFTKGAFDKLINKCSYILINGECKKLSQEDRDKLIKINNKMSLDALRVLAFAYKITNKNFSNLEEDMIFIGLAGMMDPPRKEARQAILKCKKAGLTPIMITGDHQDTAFAIARELKIAKNESQVITGEQLDNMTDNNLIKELNNFAVFARVSPEHKVRIVKAFKKQGKIVAMTGDGVNDAPSLKNADIGVGMGISGTDVAKSASNMIVTDDNFATIVVAIEEGRKVYSNIQKTIQFLLSTNIVEVLTMFLSIIFFPNFSFLVPAQILFINLITDTLPAFSLGVEKAESDVMHKKPRKSSESIFSDGVGINIIYQSLIQSALVMFVYIYGINTASNEVASTMVFALISFMQLLHSVNCKTIKSIFEINIFNNKTFNISFISTFILNILVFTLPVFKNLFNVATLSLFQWALVIILSISIIPLVELFKVIINTFTKKKNVEKINSQDF